MNIITKAGIEYIEPEREASESELSNIRAWLAIRREERNKRDPIRQAAERLRFYAEAVAGAANDRGRS